MVISTGDFNYKVRPPRGQVSVQLTWFTWVTFGLTFGGCNYSSWVYKPTNKTISPIVSEKSTYLVIGSLGDLHPMEDVEYKGM